MSDWLNIFVFVLAPWTLVFCPGMVFNPSHLSSLDLPEVRPWNDLEWSQDICNGLLGNLNVLVVSSQWTPTRAPRTSTMSPAAHISGPVAPARVLRTYHKYHIQHSPGTGFSPQT
ncbi:hypothetical protein B0H17DRAFT_1147626 [Mycena rosella]|uniref:Uncharacterized protein n=1 Tax=Mycena rosella TaxID=1033263 RepID=A0AAD7CNS0_MYCRO|nr:hypothetical protein B0H17DRAFT_1147626 [Mycena rosella]